MDKEERMHKLRNGTDTAKWAHDRIAELEAEMEGLKKQEPTDIPIGATENGKEFLRRLAAQFDYDDGRSAVAETAEYHEVMRCFNAIEEYFAQPVQPAVPDGYTMVKTETVEWLLGENGEFVCPKDQYCMGRPSPYFWRKALRNAMLLAAPKENA